MIYNMKIKILIEELLHRSQMPQIGKEELSSALRKLEAVGIKADTSWVPLKTLKPMQKTVDKGKVLEIAKAYKSNKSMAPMVVSRDNFIIDGHHRWIARMHTGKLDDVVLRMDLPRDQAFEVYKKLADNV